MQEKQSPVRGGMLPKLSEIPAFTEYMGTGWGVPDRTAAVVAGAADAAAAHRARLAEALPGRTITLTAGEAPVRSNDTTYDFRPDSDFLWLTGCPVPNAAAVLRDGDVTLYLPPPARPGDAGFFSDARYGELWVGAEPGLADWARALSVDVRPLSDLAEEMTRDEEVGRTLADAAVRQRTEAPLRPSPVPMTPPDATCVVERAKPRCVEARIVAVVAASAEKPCAGSTSVMPRPMVRMMRQPPE